MIRRLSILLLLLAGLPVSVMAQYKTLLLGHDVGPTTNDITLSEGQLLEVLSFTRNGVSSTEATLAIDLDDGSGYHTVLKSMGVDALAKTAGFTPNFKGFTLAGPMEVRVVDPDSSGVSTLFTYVVRDANATTSVSGSDGLLVPQSAVVVPSDATGTVNIILESSTDMVNWTPAGPGAYGAATGNRFFRVRAEAN